MHLNRIYTANSHPIFDEEFSTTSSFKKIYKVYNNRKCKIFVATVPILYFCTARTHHYQEKDRPESLPATPHNSCAQPYTPLGCCIFCWCFALRAACICSNCCFC
jgi:hypothetical protein